MRVLGLETSCDETAAAVVEDGRGIRSSLVASQTEIHALYGGVVPELAARAHVERVSRLVAGALDQAGLTLAEIDGLAVTTAPGLIGALFVGTAAAKALALATGKPLVGVHHLAAHAWAARLVLADAADPPPPPEPPLVALVASGGHTCLYLIETLDAFRAPRRLGSTLDDAAGEAFDKAAKLLGLGFPGGPALARAAESGDPRAYDFPRTFLNEGPELDFSFSGLKTALRYLVEGVPGGKRRRTRADLDGPEAPARPAKRPKPAVLPPPAERIPDIAASFQEAVVDVLVGKALRATELAGVRRLVLAGGVACNRRLREKLGRAATRRGVELFIPPPALCADNAAMVAGLGWLRLARGEDDGLGGEAVGGLERPGG